MDISVVDAKRVMVQSAPTDGAKVKNMWLDNYIPLPVLQLSSPPANR